MAPFEQSICLSWKGTEELNFMTCKIWRKLSCELENDMRSLRQFFTRAFEILKIGTLMGPFIESRKCMRLTFTWKMMQNLTRNWLAVSKLTSQFDEFWPEHSNGSKICTLMGSFWPKYVIFELKKYRRVMFDSTEDWWSIWRKTDMCFQNWHEEFGKLL